jgi:uncharacterized protein YcbK (DUF882 family)
MGDISKHFNRSEFGCKCSYPDCEDIAVDVALVTVLEDVREHFGKPVTINSSYRCEPHNRDEGGAKHSQHRLGIAADIVVKNIHPHKVYEYLNSKHPDQYGMGKYNTFTHVDTRSYCARW